jgi:regulator of sirC expression with transglutaminase-like and TPR domain
MALSFSGDVEFNKLRSGQGDADLVGVMLELAADAYPDLDAGACCQELNRLRDVAIRRVAESRGALADQLNALGRLLYREEGFFGNRESYYDPRNSYLNQVLERRCGIPISLAILYMHVAVGAGLRVHGVSTPGHFMLCAMSPTERWFIDPFGDGELLSEDECRTRVQAVFDPSAAIPPECFQPASTLEIVVRVLRNLKAAYAMNDQWAEALPVQERLLALLPDRRDEKRDLGLINLRSGHPHEALTLLGEYVSDCDEETARQMQPYLRTARKMAAELN